MDSGFYAACTALMARTNALDAIANDLANTNTTGFRGQEDTFGSVMAAAGAQPNNLLNQAANNYGILGQTTLNLTQGPLILWMSPSKGPDFLRYRPPAVRCTHATVRSKSRRRASW
jgi:flagellar basal body rod protein FlgF